MKTTKQIIKEYMASNGKKGGQSKSPKKILSSLNNLKLAMDAKKRKALTSKAV